MKLIGALLLATGVVGVYCSALLLRRLMVPPLPSGLGIMVASFGGGVFVALGLLALSAGRKES